MNNKYEQPTERRARWHAFFSLLAMACLLFLFVFQAPANMIGQQYNSTDLHHLPDFSVYRDVKQKKQAFFDYLYPAVRTENRRLILQRKFIEGVKARYELGIVPTATERLQLLWLLRQFKVSDKNVDWKQRLQVLLTRVDSIPDSLILAQAAIESGWGQSRFARKGNNLFGQWCFKKGCGIVPRQRQSDKSHEVARFASVSESIRAYMTNLNSFKSYADFRKQRASLRANKKSLDVNALLPTLHVYSQEGHDYVAKIAKVIRLNRLDRYDRKSVASQG